MYVSKNVNHARAMELCNDLGVGLTMDLGKYLGMPLLHKRVKEETDNEIMEKIRKILNIWR